MLGRKFVLRSAAAREVTSPWLMVGELDSCGCAEREGYRLEGRVNGPVDSALAVVLISGIFLLCDAESLSSSHCFLITKAHQNQLCNVRSSSHICLLLVHREPGMDVGRAAWASAVRQQGPRYFGLCCLSMPITGETAAVLQLGVQPSNGSVV